MLFLSKLGISIPSSDPFFEVILTLSPDAAIEGKQFLKIYIGCALETKGIMELVSEIIAGLEKPSAYNHPSGNIQRIITGVSVVFLVTKTVLKKIEQTSFQVLDNVGLTYQS